MKRILLISIIMLVSACSSFNYEPVKLIEKEEVKVEINKPKFFAPEPLVLKKIITPKAFVIDGTVMYCLNEQHTKAQAYNTKEYKRYLKEMLLFIESLEEKTESKQEVLDEKN